MTSQALADASAAGQFQLTFSSHAPGSATGLEYLEVYRNPSDPNAKPSPVRRTILQLPAGSVLDGHAIASCQSSDTELMLLGPSACPAASRIGQGTAETVSGLGPPFDPFPADATLFNGGTQTIEMFARHGTSLTLMVGHQQYSGRSTLTESPAPIPGGPPDGQSAPTRVDFAFARLVGPSGQAFITTPAVCPPAGQWISTLTFTNADGHTYTLHSSTPCTAPRATAKRPPRAAAKRSCPSRSRARRGRSVACRHRRG